MICFCPFTLGHTKESFITPPPESSDSGSLGIGCILVVLS